MSAESVLVIDDDDVARTVIASVLVRAGFRTHSIASPIGATRAIREHHVTAVVCDLHMPAMRGDALVKVFKQSQSLRDVLLLLVTSTPLDEIAALHVQAGADAVVHKSELETVLVDRLRALFGARR
jgi:CheY-like chemotaxis protein